MDGGRRNAQNEDNQQTDLLCQGLQDDSDGHEGNDNCGDYGNGGDDLDYDFFFDVDGRQNSQKNTNPRLQLE